MSDRSLGSADAVSALAEQLSRIDWIEGAPTPHDDEPPSWTLADGLADIELECRRLVDESLPRLVRATDPSQAQEILAEIRIGLQHIVYHLATTPALRSLIDDAPPLFEGE